MYLVCPSTGLTFTLPSVLYFEYKWDSKSEKENTKNPRDFREPRQRFSYSQIMPEVFSEVNWEIHLFVSDPGKAILLAWNYMNSSLSWFFKRTYCWDPISSCGYHDKAAVRWRSSVINTMGLQVLLSLPWQYPHSSSFFKLQFHVCCCSKNHNLVTIVDR